MFKRLFAATLFFLLAPLASAASSAYTLLDFPVTDGPVNAIAADAGHVYLGGNFNRVGQRCGNLVFWDMGTNSRLPVDPAVTGGDVKVALADGVGGWYIGGSFNKVSSSASNRLAHIFASGSLDPLFISPLLPYGAVTQLVFYSGYLFVGGDLNLGSPLFYQNLVKLDPTNGQVQATFTAPYTSFNAITATGASIYIGGLASGLHSGVYKLSTATGAVDNAFDLKFNSGLGTIYALAVSASSLVVGGDFTNLSLTARKNLVIADLATGLVDPSFAPDPDGVVTGIGTGIGSIYAAGSFNYAGGLTRPALVALDATGLAQASFDAGMPGASAASLISDNGKLLIRGSFTSVSGQARTYFARLNAFTGATDAVDPAPFNPPGAIATQGSTLVLAGPVGSVGGLPRQGVARIDALTGLVDAGFNAQLDGPVTDLLLNGADLYISGGFGHLGGVARDGLARLNLSDGTLATLFNAPMLGTLKSLALNSSGLYVGGYIYSLNGVGTTKYVVRLSPSNGSVDTGFNPALSDNVKRLLLSGDDLYASTDNFSNGLGLFKFSASSGASHPEFQCQVGGNVSGMAITQRGLTIVGGFIQIQGHSQDGLARLNTLSGALDPGFSPAASSQPAVVLASGPELYLGGYMTQFMGQARGRLAKMDANEAVDSFDGALDSPVVALALSPDGRTLYAGGSFNNAQGRPNPGFVAYRIPAAAAWPAKFQGYLPSPVDHDIVGPVPAKAGDPVCAAFTNKPAATHLTAFNARGEKVADYDFAGGADACWDTTGVAPGFYFVRTEVTDLAGKKRERTHKVMVTK